jgi:hypothetical protein
MIPPGAITTLVLDIVSAHMRQIGKAAHLDTPASASAHVLVAFEGPAYCSRAYCMQSSVYTLERSVSRSNNKKFDIHLELHDGSKQYLYRFTLKCTDMAVRFK